MVGGFGKTPGDPPGMRCLCKSIRQRIKYPTDIYHSSLGLAALAAMKEPSLKTLDPVLCISIEQRDKINRLRNEALKRS